MNSPLWPNKYFIYNSMYNYDILGFGATPSRNPVVDRITGQNLRNDSYYMVSCSIHIKGNNNSYHTPYLQTAWKQNKKIQNNF